MFRDLFGFGGETNPCLNPAGADEISALRQESSIFAHPS